MQQDKNISSEKEKEMKGIKKALVIVGICFGALVVLTIVIGIFVGGSDSTQETSNQQEEESTRAETKEENKETDYIAMVQTGYFGEFTDATVKEILDLNFGVTGFTQDWVGSDMDGKEYVAFYSYESGKTPDDGTTILFQICSDETFKVSGYAQNGKEGFESMEIADLLNYWYMNWYVKNRIGEEVSESEIMEKMQELIHNQFDNISGTASLYGASKNYSGDRESLWKEIDNVEPIDMTVTELINYYNNDILDIYVSEKFIGDTEEEELSSGTDGDGYSEKLHPIEGGDDIISLYTNENGNLCVWYGNITTEEEYYSKIYDSYTFEDNVIYGYFENDMDEFDFMEDGYVDVLLSGYGSTHYQSYMTEEAFFNG